MSIHRFLVGITLVSSSLIVCMELSKEKSDMQDVREESREEASSEQLAAKSDEASQSSSSFSLDMLTIPGVGKPLSLAIFGVGASAVLGTALYGAKRGLGFVKAKLFANKLRNAGSDNQWSVHCMNFLADVSLHIPALSGIWEEQGSIIQQDPHCLLLHDSIIAEFADQEKNEFLGILHEYTDAHALERLQKILNISRDSLVDQALSPAEILKKHLARCSPSQRDDLTSLEGEIDALRDMQEVYCSAHGLKNPYKKIASRDWMGRMQKLIDEVQAAFPDLKIPFDAQNIFFLTPHENFMEKLNDEHRQECAAIFDVWIDDIIRKEIELIIPSTKRHLIQIAHNLLLVEPKDWAADQAKLFDEAQLEDLKKLYVRVKIDKRRKEELFVKSSSLPQPQQ